MRKAGHMLTVRYPKFDFSACFPRWAPHLEFTQYFNAVSLAPCAVEPFAIKVFQKAREHLHPVKDAQLIREVEWFIAQEAQHYRQHAKFNKCFQTERYPKIAAFDRRFRDEMNEFLETKSLEFLLGYVEGFEAAGAVWYQMWFEELDAYKQGARSEPLELFDWHYAEEYEHREGAFKLYNAIAARGSPWRRIFYGYFYRIWATRFAMQHMAKHIDAARRHLLDMDRIEMTADERDASHQRENDMLWHIGSLIKKGIRAIYSPFYNPSGKPPPRGLSNVLRQYAPQT
jgi:uncharacterized protein